ncbi:MAG: prefoldin subunit alpha [Nanoarchaeota archaeon]|nr:prefoldin subunit alpha [Nanoarchaeota archaeon]MBU1501376.1 prefoldin subunit alpha [Nanoarchaeota archaeon]MBU2458818.1 prefoldin subunit alpha [Nanoarchaeota archaeon]
MEEKEQELMLKLSMFEQQMRQLQQQFQAVEESITELMSLDIGLDEIKGSTGKEVLAQIGRGIFVKAEIKSEDLTVNVGNKNLVKKSVPETKEILKEQIEKLEGVKKGLEEKMDEVQEEAKRLILEAQKE